MSGTFNYKSLCRVSNFVGIFLIFCLGVSVSSCNQQARGFAFPEGNIEAGKTTFVVLACTECHKVSDIDWTGTDDGLKIHLGGEVPSLKSYGELVTSIINPSHKIARSYKYETATADGQSKMRNYNEVMTVQQLIDVVTFLQPEYKIRTPRTNYRPYQY